MPEFNARIATSAGRVLQKTYTAADAVALRRELESQDLLVLDLRQQSPVFQQIAKSLRFGGGIPTKDFLFFNQELRALMRAGLPIVPSLDILLERRKHKTFRRVLTDVRERVKSGEALSEAFAAHGDLFPKLYSASLASGERSGELLVVIERFVAYMKKLLSIRRRVISALVYPAILISLFIGLIAMMVLFIIPRFSVFLTDFGTDLPLVTRAMMAVSHFAIDYWYWLGLGIVATFFTLTWWSRTAGGRVGLDKIKLRLPLVGRVIHDYAQNRFTRTLSTLQAGGIPLVTSLELSARAVGNAVFERELLLVAEKVREGRSLWESLDETRLISDMAVQMVKVGESTGALDAMLQDTSDFTDDEIDAQLSRIMSLVEPLMLVAMAIVVATMLLSIYYPLLQVYGQASA